MVNDWETEDVSQVAVSGAPSMLVVVEMEDDAGRRRRSSGSFHMAALDIQRALADDFTSDPPEDVPEPAETSTEGQTNSLSLRLKVLHHVSGHYRLLKRKVSSVFEGTTPLCPIVSIKSLGFMITRSHSGRRLWVTWRSLQRLT